MIRHHLDLNTTHRCMILRCMLMCFRCVRNTEQVCAIDNVSDLCSGGAQLNLGQIPAILTYVFCHIHRTVL